jgi:acyl carrier protein
MSDVTANDILKVIAKADVVSNIEALTNDRPLRDQGMDSLDYASVLFSLEEIYDIKIPDEDIDNLKTVDDIARYVNGKL